MSYIVPFAYLTEKERLDLLMQWTSTALKAAAEKISSTKQFVVRTFEPGDVSAKFKSLMTNRLASSNEWLFNIDATGEVTVLDGVLGDDVVILFYGLAYPDESPVITGIEFKTGAETVKRYYIEEVLVYDKPVAFFREPVLYRPGSRVIINVLAKGTDSAEKFIPLVLLAEPVGVTIGRP